MYPHERSLVEEMKSRPFAFIGVNSDSVDDAKKAIEREGLNWRNFQNQRDAEGASHSKDWKIRAWPTLVVIDAEFRIRYRGHDGDRALQLARKLVRELEESE